MAGATGQGLSVRFPQRPRRTGMAIDPQTIRCEPHTEIGDLLQQHAGAIIERWGRRAAEEQPNAPRLHHAALVDHLTEFLRTLGRSLATSEAHHAGQHRQSASAHGGQRWEAGWSLPEVVRDYQILRLVIVDFLEETLDRLLGYREVLALGLALDEAISASVVRYVKQREEQRAAEEKQAQDRLREQAEALRAADRRKNEYLAMLAHELRNPLAPVRNALHILRLKGPPDPDLDWARDVVERQLQHLTRMVD